MKTAKTYSYSIYLDLHIYFKQQIFVYESEIHSQTLFLYVDSLYIYIQQ